MNDPYVSIFSNDFTYPEAVPEPLRIHHQGHRPCDLGRLPMSKHQISQCNSLSKLPPQPILGSSEHPAYVTATYKYTEGIIASQEPAQAASCKCRTTPTSPLAPQLDLNKSIFCNNNTRMANPSLDFSALFMKSPVLRHGLENCACNRNRLF